MLDRAAERTDTILGRQTAYGYGVGYGPNRNRPRIGFGGRFVRGSVARPEGFEPPTY